MFEIEEEFAIDCFADTLSRYITANPISSTTDTTLATKEFAVICCFN